MKNNARLVYGLTYSSENNLDDLEAYIEQRKKIFWFNSFRYLVEKYIE
jgi:hypothetical protein